MRKERTERRDREKGKEEIKRMKRMVDFPENLLAVVQTKKEKGFPSKTVRLPQGSPVT